MTVKSTNTNIYGEKRINPLDHLSGKRTALVALVAFLIPVIVQMFATIGSAFYLIAKGQVDPTQFLNSVNSNFNTVAFFVSECIGALVVLILLRKQLKAILENLKSVKNIIVIVALTLMSILVVEGWGMFCNSVLNVGANENQNIVVGSLDYLPVLSVIVVGFIVPILEEVVFRAGIFGLVKRVNKPLAYVLSVFLFAILHFSFSGNMNVELLNLPSYIICGLLLTYTYDKYGLAGSVLAHSINNVVAVVTALMFAH